MKTLALPLLAALILSLQEPTAWKKINEMSGPIPNQPSLTVETYVAEIARSENIVKLSFRVDFPQGAPFDWFRKGVPPGFDVSSINRISGRIQLNCETFVIKPEKGSAEVYLFNGKRLKSKEPSFNVFEGHVLEAYFCERGASPTTAPKLKPQKSTVKPASVIFAPSFY